MYDNNFNRYGSMLQRPGGVDIDELRRRRASMDSRMSPMPVTPRPRPEEDEPQQESGAAQAIRQFSQMAATGLMGQAGDRPDASPASGSQARQMPGSDQMRTPPFVPTGGNTALPPSSVFMGNNAPQIPPATPPPTLPARPPASPVAPATPVSVAPPVQPTAGPELNQYTLANRPQMMSLPQQPLPPSNISAMAPPASARPQSRDPIQRARNEAIYGGELQAQIGMKPKRGFWDIVKTAGVGALQGMATGGGLGGAIGGALAGGITSAIDPATGRAYRFDVMQRPGMEADIARQMAYAKFGREQQLGEIDLRKRQAEAEQTEAETRYLPARYGQESALRQSQIKRNEASAIRDSRPPAPPKPSPGVLRTVQGPDGQPALTYVTPENVGQARPYVKPERPSSGGGRGGGGGQPAKPEKIVNLPEPLIKMLNDAEDLRLYAESAWGTAENDPQTGKPIPGSNAGEKLRKEYVQALNRIKQLFPDYVNVLPGVGEGGKALPDWPYVERRR